MLRIARELLYLRPKGHGTNIGAATDLLMRLAKRPASPSSSPTSTPAASRASMRLAAQKHDITAISLTDPRELELPRAGLVRLRDAETGARPPYRHRGPARSAQQYAEDAAGASVDRRRLLASLGVDEIALRTDRSYVQPLMAYFRARAAHRRIT